MPAVSVLVPCYNVEKFIRQCMDSIVGQTLTDLEIICLNDGSTDGTLGILQEYAAKDSRVRIIDKANSGYGDSMNKGLEAATGEYIGIVESDDFIRPAMYENMLTLALQSGADMVRCAHEEYWSLPERFSMRKVPDRYANLLVTPEEVADFSRFHTVIWSSLYKRQLIEKNNIRFVTTPGASYQDVGFFFKTWASACSIYVSNQAYYLYRQDNINSSIKSRKKIFALAHEYHSCELFLKKNGLEKKWANALNKLKYSSFLWNFNRLDLAGRRRFLPLLRKELAEILESPHTKFFNRNHIKKMRLIVQSPNVFFFKAIVRDAIKKGINVFRNK